MKIIKVSAGGLEKTSLLLRQSVNSEGVWNDCRFIINDNKLEKCDWWFVLHGTGLAEFENCLCDPDHVVYVSMEPTEKISQVSDKFLEQFSRVYAPFLRSYYSKLCFISIAKRSSMVCLVLFSLICLKSL